MITDKLKNSYRILFEPTMENELLHLKQTSKVTIAEHVRRAVRLYLTLKDEKTGLVDDMTINRFWSDWRQAEKERVAKAEAENAK